MSVVKTVCKAMERIAPLRLAEKWDNVGLLLESPFQRPNASRVLLTIDLTPSVLSEALSTPTAFIVSYHPPIFKPLSSFTLANPLQTSLLRCAAEGISVFSPHTALDSMYGGINDWLAEGIIGTVPGQPLSRGLKTVLKDYKRNPEGEPEGGEGRLVTLDVPISVGDLANRIKTYLNLTHIEVGYSINPSRDVKTVAICAGSGGSMLLGVDADVYFTGEMAHHEVLAAVAAGKHVILCGHTNTERGYLSTLASNLMSELAKNDGSQSYFTGLQVEVSQEDQHPLQIV